MSGDFQTIVSLVFMLASVFVRGQPQPDWLQKLTMSITMQIFSAEKTQFPFPYVSKASVRLGHVLVAAYPEQ